MNFYFFIYCRGQINKHIGENPMVYVWFVVNDGLLHLIQNIFGKTAYAIKKIGY